MNILDFTKKYSRHYTEQCEDWPKDWSDLLQKCKENETLTLCFHTLLENYFSFEYLKELIEYDETGQNAIFNDCNTFKWACAFGNRYLIIYLNDKVKEHNLSGAINATFMQYRVDNLQTLEFLGYEKEIYTDANMCQAISRADQVGCSLDIVEYLFNRIEKFPTLSDYFWKKLEEKKWFDKIFTTHYEKKSYRYEKTYNILMDLNSEQINKEVLKNIDNFIGLTLYNGQTYLLDKLMTTHVKNNFIIKYNRDKTILLEKYLSLDKNDTVSYIIEKHPEILTYQDIKLWMLNERSLTIKSFIEKYRTIELEEIKQSFITLSTNYELFKHLIRLYPNVDYQKFNIQESIKILNNHYDDLKFDIIDMDYNSEYMILSRNLLLHNKDFKQHYKEIGSLLYDQEMYALLCKERFKKELEENTPQKKVIKRIKI